ncbi:DUF3106 domain-containing protein [Paraburkholderia rhizosphaerae]|uniref:Uncharacterized protein DUF3106 n=1 Tax=Paraburkholderia rhizosphaerae TaxID=480658 RepID=A0A4R8L533_9BURK|nr:DUF3106 domain-containing protein [Paraburkholderia rhizosphaerae]TDY37098.1 uncharacterized protein DUF3106 [Paraburkholderia rhizosphaerae]
MSYKRGLAVVNGCVIAGVVAYAATYPRFHPPAPAHATAPANAPQAASKPAAPALAVDIPGLQKDGPLAWSRLTNAEHIALAPFASQWDTFSDARKRKWLKIAARYPKMSPEAQKHLHEQMTEWVRMTPEQHRIARENYQISKGLSRETRQNAWKAYQELPEEQKERLAASEHRRRPTVVSAPPSGKTELKDINRLVNGKDRAASGAAGKPAPGASGVSGGNGAPAALASAAVAASMPTVPSMPSAPSDVPPTPTPVSPADAPAAFNGS